MGDRWAENLGEHLVRSELYMEVSWVCEASLAFSNLSRTAAPKGTCS